MKAVPDQLRLRDDGSLEIADGAPAGPYLAQWSRERDFIDREPVCVLSRRDLQALFDELWEQRYLCRCA